MPRQVLLNEVWGYNSAVTTHTLETHIYRLRQKIEAGPVPTTRLLLTEQRRLPPGRRNGGQRAGGGGLTDARKPPMVALAPASKPTVLVVEDKAMVALMVEDMLAEGGYRSAWSPDGRSGPAAPERAAEAGAAVVDLRLLDGQDGRDVIRRLRERRPDLPVVVVTGFHPEAPQADLRGLGGPTLRLPKPIDHDDLLDGLAALLRPRAEGKSSRRRASDAPALDAA